MEEPMILPPLRGADNSARLHTPLAVLAVATAVSAAGVAWQQWLHSAHESGHTHLAATHWLLDSALALPAMLVVVALAGPAARRLTPRSPSGGRVSPLVATGTLIGAGAALVLAAGGPVHAPLLHGTAAHGQGGVLLHAVREVLVSLPVTLTVALAALLLLRMRRPSLSARRVLATVTGTALLGSLVVGLPVASAAPAANGPCPAGARDITYDLAAFQNVIPINGWGDKLPDGLQYALKNDGARGGKADIVANPNLSAPIVVRANVGDCITVKLRNDIAGRRVGVHPDGLVQFDPKTSDGARVGNNPDTTAATGQERTYTWYADRVGEAPVLDMANLDGSPRAAARSSRPVRRRDRAPEGSDWRNPVTGRTCSPADRRASRAQCSPTSDAPERSRSPWSSWTRTRTSRPQRQAPTFPPPAADSSFGINYRSEPLRNRLRAAWSTAAPIPREPHGHREDDHPAERQGLHPERPLCDGYVPELGKVVEDPGAKCMNEESHLQSWIFGDEGKLSRTVGGTVVTDSDNLIPKAYVGDKIRFHVIHPGASETHPWHQHTQRWRRRPRLADRVRTRRTRTCRASARARRSRWRSRAAPAARSGRSVTRSSTATSTRTSPAGFWGHLRIFDRLRDGTQRYPDGTPLQNLTQLPDRVGATPAATAERPGFPLFVKGDVGQRAYRPPNSVVKDDFAPIRRPGDAPRKPDALEAANLPALDPAKPGAGYIDPCPTTAPLRTYRPHVIDTPLVYNSAKWTDRQGRIYVEEAQAGLTGDAASRAATLKTFRDSVLAGTRQPEPYTIRSRQGECVQVLTTNDLHLDEDPKVPLDHVNRLDGDFMHEEETSEVSSHVHLVKFDQLASDGTSVGWNYVHAAMPGQTYGYRWYVDTALRTVFFHDHQYANLHQQKGCSQR
jgi:hypothetical protein